MFSVKLKQNCFNFEINYVDINSVYRYSFFPTNELAKLLLFESAFLRAYVGSHFVFETSKEVLLLVYKYVTCVRSPDAEPAC